MKKKRGSILIYVMVIFAVLMIMGVTLTTLSLQSMKNRKYYSNNRVNLYYSESGIDDAYGIASEYVKAASNYVTNETNNEIDRLINDDKIKLEEIFYNRENLNNDTLEQEEKAKLEEEINSLEKDLKFFNNNGELNTVTLKDEQNRLFKIYYEKFFTYSEDGKETNLKKLINALEAYTYSTKDDESITVKVINNNNDEVTMEDDKFTIKIQSTFSNDIGSEKIISADLKFTTPDYGSKISFPTKYKVFTESPVWNKGIVVNKTLSIESGELNVNGDIYAKGIEEKTDTEEKEKAILLNSDNSELNVENGKVIACEGVKFNYDYEIDKSSGAEVDIKNGGLFTKGILFNEGAQGATLHVDDSIYVLDDSEINAKNSTLTVGDSYYGVSSGEDSKGNKVDNSSSIIINSEDLRLPGSEKKGSNVSIGGKVYLAGTSYIRRLKNPAYGEAPKYDYQTGESISIKGNYKAYSDNLKDSFTINETDDIEGVDLKYELEKTMLDPLVLATHYSKYSKWFTIYDEKGVKKIYYDMDNKLKQKYENMGWLGHYKIKEPNFEDKKFEMAIKMPIDPNELSSIIDDDEINIELVDVNGKVIKDTKNIKVPRLQEDIEAFKSGEDKVYITITPKGKMESSLNGANYVNVEGVKGGFNEFVEITTPIEDDKVSIEICNSDGEILSPQNFELNLLSYSTFFENFNVFDKSKYFAHFFNEDIADDTEKRIIHNGEGISISDIENSIYTGAIISGKVAKSTNYMKRDTDNDNEVRLKKAELKDKIFYMDMFEKSKEDAATLEHQSLYMVTPKKLLNIKKDEKNFNATGLYISTSDELTEFPNPNDKVGSGSCGIIICKGDVRLKEGFNFTGTIITLGNMFVVDDSDDINKQGVTITYDDALVKRVVAKNYDTLKDVFVNLPGYEFDKVKIEVYENQNQADISEPLTIEKWAVIK